MREFGLERDPVDENSSTPNLLGWMGRAFGDAVERGRSELLFSPQGLSCAFEVALESAPLSA
jgi:hypothetical protein